MTLGEFIKKYREEHGLSIRGFAELSGVSIQQISNIEKGIGNNGKKMTSTMKTYKKIAEAVGMSGADFMNMLKRPLVQIQSLGPKNDGKCGKFVLFRHFFIAKILPDIGAYFPITKAVTKQKEAPPGWRGVSLSC